MALTRIWRPSPNYSSGPHQGRLVVVHTSEGATTEASLSNYLAQSSSQVSYQVCFDNQGSPGSITECVKPDKKAWAAMSANSWGVHGACCTPSGASSGWSRTSWQNQDTMLRKCGAWIGEECARFGVPIVKINADEIRAGRSGVCGHGDCSGAGAGGSHTDPGPNFPWDVALTYAGGVPGAPAPTPPPATGSAPPFPGTMLINLTRGHGTAQWQAQMATRGWTIAVDDVYGSQSEAVCRSFQLEKGLTHDGVVGPETWAAAWTLPVT